MNFTQVYVVHFYTLQNIESKFFKIQYIARLLHDYGQLNKSLNICLDYTVILCCFKNMFGLSGNVTTKTAKTALVAAFSCVISQPGPTLY